MFSPAGRVLYSRMEPTPQPAHPPLRPPVPFPPGVHLRPGTTADFPSLAGFLTAAHPNRPVSPDDLQRFEDSRLDAEPWHLTLAEQDGQLVGRAEVSVPRMDGHDGWLSVDIATHPERGGPLAGALLALAEAQAAQLGAHTFVARLRESGWEKAFYEARGYAEHDRMWMSTLDLTTLDFQRFSRYEKRAQAAGIRIQPLSELGEFGEAQQRRLYGLIAALLRDVPSTTPISVWPFEVWQRRFVRNFGHAEGLVVAIAPGSEWVGLSEMRVPDASHPSTLRTGLTGVLPQWRGQGVAYALKLAAARSGLARGYTHTRTGNHSINKPMLSINDALGFQREEATVTLVKKAGGTS